VTESVRLKNRPYETVEVDAAEKKNLEALGLLHESQATTDEGAEKSEARQQRQRQQTSE